MTRRPDSVAADGSGWRRQDAGAGVDPVAALVRDYSVETVPESATKIAEFAGELPPGTAVYVVAPPGRRMDEVVDTARRLHQAGLRPVPHLVARGIADHDHLAELLRRLTAQAEIAQVLVVGGSTAKPVGAFHCALQILRTGLLERFGIRRVGVAGFPEGHPTIPQRLLLAALQDKLDWGRGAQARVHVVTQFCFDPDRLLTWERNLRARFGRIPVHVGISGPASPACLVKYARICGIGASVRYLTRGASALHKLPLWSADQFLARLASEAAAEPDCGFEKAHFYTFGGVAQTARWLAALNHHAPVVARRTRPGDTATTVAATD